MAPSRRIVTFDWLTADGYFAGRDGNLNWGVPDDEQAKSVNEVATLKRQPGKNMMIFGSASIVSQLTQHRLIDEYQFVVGPVSSAMVGGCSRACRRA